MGTKVRARVCVQGIGLQLEFQGVCPVIVPFAQGYVLPPDQRKAVGRADRNPFRILVLFLEYGLEQGGIPLYVLPDDIGRAVRRGIIVHHHLEGEGGLLAYETLQGIPDIGRLVIRKADDGYFGLIHR